MPGIEELLEAFDKRVSVRPSHREPNIVDLSRAVARAAGSDAAVPTLNSTDMERQIGNADHVVSVLLDGVGMFMVETMPPDSFLRQHLVDELSTAYPSTTSVALTSLATGAWPAEHGVTGWWTHISEIDRTAIILRYVTRSDDRDLAELGADVEEVFPAPSIIGAIGRDSLMVIPSNIADSTYSTYFGGGHPTVGYGSLEQGVSTVIDRVAGANEPMFSYLYTPQVDSLAHLHGMT